MAATLFIDTFLDPQPHPPFFSSIIFIYTTINNFMVRFLIILYLIVFSTFANGDDRHGVEMLQVNPSPRHIKVEDKLSDIIKHCEPEIFDATYGRSTQAHETVHVINSFMRNRMFKKGHKRANTFYCGNGKAVMVENPNISIRHVSRFVPGVLRGGRYNLYFVEQLQYWDDTPTYIMDEWSAYIAGAEVGVEDFLDNGLPKEKSDIVCGALEFSIYSVALCMATKECDPQYWLSDERLKDSVKYLLIRAEKVYFRGCEHFPSEKQSRLLESLRFDKEASDVRNFLVNEFDSIFIK